MVVRPQLIRTGAGQFACEWEKGWYFV